MTDRILEIADLLMGAAHADKELRAEEEVAVRDLLTDLLKVSELPADVDARLRGFDPGAWKLATTAARFASDATADKRKLIELVAAVHDADDEMDLAENEYLVDLARALGLPAAEIADLELDYEVEDLRDHLRALRKPPPIPA